jgi:RNase H-fold protein (predicted Holliday junction resolvase)
VRVLAVDPGREKCGVAVSGPEGVVTRRVIGIADLPALLRDWVTTYGIRVVVVGNQTGSKRVFDIARGLPVAVEEVAERGSTLQARERYFADHPPRGWKRLIPRSLQVPPEPYDDYAAIVLAEAYLERMIESGGNKP